MSDAAQTAHPLKETRVRRRGPLVIFNSAPDYITS